MILTTGCLVETSTFIGILKRNKLGGDIADMNMFSDMIIGLDLVNIPFSGRSFTWSNMQSDPLLVKLYWILTSVSWALKFPATFVLPLSRPISDHIPYVLHIGTSIPKANLFRFENFWIHYLSFKDIVQLHQHSSPFFANSARNLSGKFKQVRIGMRNQSKSLSNLSKLIFNCNSVLLLDGLEDQRPLSTLEAAFRSLVKEHLGSLLESKRIYWKQRNSVRWVNLRDENTHFFHSMATVSHKKNFIVSLVNHDGSLIVDHDQKDNLLWTAFKDRLGVSDFTAILYDLDALLTAHNLEGLDEDFSTDEIDMVIKNLPNSHAPGPDGFNGLFIKNCRNIIQDDFIKFFRDFCQHNIDLTSLSSSFIALIPKKDNPESVDDYRPISLLNYSLKCITKLLSIRLQKVILQLIHNNQYGFIKGRTIQDCLGWAFQFLHICHKSKREIVILKLDFKRLLTRLNTKSSYRFSNIKVSLKNGSTGFKIC